MKRYQKTHPWITFQVDFSRAPAEFWLLMGEASAMCNHIACAPVRPKVSDEMHRVYFAKGVLATTAIEGNTLSEEQVLAQLDGKLTVPPSKEYQKRETANVIDACNEIWEAIQRNQAPALTSALVKEYNARVLAGLENLPDHVVPGEIPESVVGVGSYRGAPREDCEYLLERLSAWLNGLDSSLWPKWPHPSVLPKAVIKAVLAHLYIAWIHPFGDGNGRTARLVEFLLLANAGFPTPAAHLLSNHYNDTRPEYYRQLDRASRTGGDVFGFLFYAAQGLVDGLKAQVEFIREEHLASAWHSFVLETFRPMRRSEAASRQRDLVLDLSTMKKPVERRNLPLISQEVAEKYRGKTMKTVSRDIGRLMKLDLLRKLPDGGYVAATDRMLGFTPFRREVDSF